MTFREWLRKCQFPIILALGSYPATIVLAFFFAPALMPYTWIFPVAMAVSAVILLLLPGKLRVALGICGAVAMILLCFVKLDGQMRNVALTFVPIYSVMLLWCLFLPSWDFRREIPAGWLGACLVCGMIGCFFAWAEPQLAAYDFRIRACFIGFVFLSLLSLNRGSINLAMGLSQGCPVSMRRKNQLLTIGIFAIAALISLIPWLFDIFENLLRYIVLLIAWIEKLLTKKESDIEETAVAVETTENWMDTVLDGTKTHRTSEEFLVIVGVIAVIVAGLLFYFAGRRLIEVVRNAIRLLGKLLVTATATNQNDFIDEITDTRDDAVQAAVKKKRRERILPPRNMTPNQKIRYRYQRLLSKHPEWKRNYTARDTLSEDAAKLYERARYSEHTITGEEAAHFQKKTK